MTLRELRYLVALAEHRHFGRAADACHVTQPTLSAQLRKLESYLGQVLVDRDDRQLRLTPVGQQIVERAQRILAEADGILRLTRLRREPLEGLLTLGVIPTLAPYYLPHLLRLVDLSFPKLQLVVHEGLTSELCRRLDEQALDAALLALPRPLGRLAHSAACLRCEAAVQSVPAPLDPAAYDERVLFDEPFWMAVPASHDLAARPDVAADQLGDLKLLLLSDGHCLRGQALAACQLDEPQADDDWIDCRASSLETLVQLVAAGRGCTLLPALAAERSDPARIAVKPLRSGEHRRIGLVWRRTHPRGQEFDLLADALRRSAPAGTVPWPS